MRTDKEVLEGMTVYFAKKEAENNYRIYMIQDNYSHSLETINQSLTYAKEILGLTVPAECDINIEVLRGERYNRIMSIEFDSKTAPLKLGFELKKNSGLWEWLKY